MNGSPTAEILREAPAQAPAPDLGAVATGTFGPAIGESLGAWLAARARQREAAQGRAAALAAPVAEARTELARPIPEPTAAVEAGRAAVQAQPPSRGLRAFLAPTKDEGPEDTLAKVMQGLGLLATGASGLARGDARGALVALRGAMEGWQAGDKERADRAFADWRANTDRLLARSQQEWREYEAMLKRSDLSLERRMAAVRLTALENDNQAVVAAMETEDIEKILGVLTEQQKHTETLQQKRDELLLKKGIAEQQESLGRAKLGIDLEKLGIQRETAAMISRMLGGEQEGGGAGLPGFKPSVSFGPSGPTLSFEAREKPKEAIAGLQQSAAILEGIQTMAQRLITAASPQEAWAQGARLKTEALLRTNTVAAAYEDSKQAFLGILSRTLGGERGVLTDRDIARIDKMLPGFFDTATIRDMKIGMLQNMLTTAMEAQEAIFAGRPVPANFRARIETLLAATPGVSGGATMKIRRKADGKVFEGPKGAIPDGFEAVK